MLNVKRKAKLKLEVWQGKKIETNACIAATNFYKIN